jgi:adenosylhomocysteine nucleosidase
MERRDVAIAVVTALPEESAAARGFFGAGDHEFAVAQRSSGESLAFLTTGPGKVQAAASLAEFLAEWRPKVLVGAGIGGAVAGAVSVGDVIVASRVGFYDVDATALGYPLGSLERRGSGVIPVSREARLAADLHLLQDAVAAAAPDVGEPPVVHQGLVVTGDTVLTRRTLDALPEDWRERINDALAVDMESAVWVSLAQQQGIPVLLFRHISDHVVRGDRAGFVRACEETGAILREVVRLLSLPIDP